MYGRENLNLPSILLGFRVIKTLNLKPQKVNDS